MSQSKNSAPNSKWVRTVDFVLNHKTKIMVGCGAAFVALAAMGAKAAYDHKKDQETQRTKALLRDSEHAMKSRDYDGQVECLSAVLTLQPNHTIALTNRANALCVLGRFEEALADAKAVLKQEKTVRGLMVKGRALRGMKEYRKALVAYNKVLKHPDLSDVIKASVLKSIDGIEQEIRNKKANQKLTPLEQAKKDLLSSSVPQRTMSSVTATSISMPSVLFSSSSSSTSSSTLDAEEENMILRIQQQINAAQSKHEQKISDAATSSSLSSSNFVDAQITVASDGSPLVSIIPIVSSSPSSTSSADTSSSSSSAVSSEVTVLSSSIVVTTPNVVMEESSILVESSEHKAEAEEDGRDMTQSQIMGESGVLLSQSEVREAQEQDREQQ